MLRQLCTSMLLAAVWACAGSPSTANDGNGPATARNADVITAEELADPSVANGDALEAVKRLRPRFLMTRGASSVKNTTAGNVHVSVDNGPLLTVENLSCLRSNQIAEIRYLNASDAAQRFGSNAAGGGVIVVKSK